MIITDTTKREAALNFLRANRTGVLATISPEGVPHARLVYYACDDSFGISFLTLSTTRKVADLAANQRVAFTVATEAIPQALQMEGTVTDITAEGVVDEALSMLTENWLSNSTYSAPLAQVDAGAIKHYRLTPTWIRWEDFTSEEKITDILVDTTMN